MRIYFACTVRGDRRGVGAGRAICGRLQQHGHQVLTTHVLADDVEAAAARLSEEEVFRRDIDWLSRCEVLVAEASGSSAGVGFEVGFVLGRAASAGQRVVLLYEAARHAISRLITGNGHDACTTFAYTSIQDLTAFTIDALRLARSKSSGSLRNVARIPRSPRHCARGGAG